MLQILNDAALNMTYSSPVTVTVEIVVDKDTYYISERDFLKIDAAMINSSSTLSNDTQDNTTETTQE